MRKDYLKLLSEGKSKATAAKLCKLDSEDIDDWYTRGKSGETEYADFYNEYLKKHNLSFKTLKEIRNSYNLSQELFAKALGWSKKTIVRYVSSLKRNIDKWTL